MGALPTSWDGQVFAIEGHTLGAVDLKPHIRIWGIQAPELRDAAAEAEARKQRRGLWSNWLGEK